MLAMVGSVTPCAVIPCQTPTNAAGTPYINWAVWLMPFWSAKRFVLKARDYLAN